MLSLLFSVCVAASLVSAGSHDESAFARRKHHHKHFNHTKSDFETRGQYTLVSKSQGANFFDDWTFFNGPDPTNGQVNYQTKTNAFNKGLAYVENNVAVIKVDNTANLGLGQNRDSVRIVTAKSYTGGLFISDIESMPYGCAVWPSHWSVGPNWPTSGEIDVIEGVNDGGVNMCSMHTSPGCSTDTSSNAPVGFQTSSVASKIYGTSCALGDDGTGCSFNDNDKASFGSAFNAGGGGVFATQWSNSGIRIFRFPRSAIPGDITSGNPNPSGWSTQHLVAAWASTACNIPQFFNNHQWVFDITLAGNWAGNTQIYKSAGCPGTPQTQIQAGSNFNNAAWRINSFTVYQ